LYRYTEAIDPAQGAVRVLIGGREYANSPFNRAVLSRRAAGSAFKPFVYLAALAEGVVNPSTLLQDEEQTFEVPEGEEKTYQPMNYTRKFKGTVSLRDCLVESLNVPTVKVAEMVGIDKVITMAHKLGGGCTSVVFYFKIVLTTS
jgi:penicillin-binding protein 1A